MNERTLLEFFEPGGELPDPTAIKYGADGTTLNRFHYDRRVQEVLNGAPACAIPAGRDHAKCILPPGHPMKLHEGPGWDSCGPKYVAWEAH